MKINPPGGFPYKWCSNSGEDEFGIWLEFCSKNILLRMRWINPGTFLMGSPAEEYHRHHSEAQHEVTLKNGFWITDTVCTQELWQAQMEMNPSKDKNAQLPVTNVSWMNCDLFLQKMQTCIDGITFSLPTEAQWEYACRAGTITPFSFGITITPDEVNYNGNFPYLGEIKGLNREKIIAVKSLQPNPWGLYEIHGNVWEWCSDWYGTYGLTSAIDPKGPGEGTYRVLRGGSAFSGAMDCRSAARSRCHLDGCYERNGFRFVWNPTLPDKNELQFKQADEYDKRDKIVKDKKQQDSGAFKKKRELVAKDTPIEKSAPIRQKIKR